MADFLLYNKIHYNNVYVKGDIIEVRPDGYYDNVDFDKNAFCVLQVDDALFNNVKHYDRPDVTMDENGEITVNYVKKYNIDLTDVDLAVSKKLKFKMNKLKLKNKSWR